MKQSGPIFFETIEIPDREVMRRMGYPAGASLQPESLKNMYEDLKNLTLSVARVEGVYRILPIVSTSGEKITFAGTDFAITNPQVVKLLRPASQAVFFMVTLGHKIGEEIQKLQESRDLTEAFMLDAIASETVDWVADRMHHGLIAKEAETAGLKVTPRFSPGYGDWPLTVQPDILNLCKGGRIGISLNESCLMSPRKSVSAVLGLIEKKLEA